MSSQYLLNLALGAMLCNINNKNMALNLTCPECKNEVALVKYPNLAPADVIECNHCGIMLGIENIAGDEVTAEIVDEGK